MPRRKEAGEQLAAAEKKLGQLAWKKPLAMNKL